MDALGWARAFDDSDAEGESEVEEDDGVVVVDRSAVDLGGGSRASTRETAPREDGARRDDGVERDGEVEGDARGGEAVGTGGTGTQRVARGAGRVERVLHHGAL